ncbi:MAG: hypothetical protein OQK51_00105 [Kangiellaceae bacterium]|nr:hypothetical protein [Kangiellaceae bacterium]
MKIRWIILVGLLLLAGCSSRSDELRELITQRETHITQAFSELKQKLNRQQLSNAARLVAYSDKVKQSHPELTELVDNLAKNAAVNGPMLLALNDRIKDLKGFPGETLEQLEEKYVESTNILEALQPKTFNDALSDSVNVLADISGGELARVNAVNKALELKANGTEDLGNGSQFIGNPQYGQWATGSNGTNFWMWYGMYRMFDDLLGGRRYSYNRWSRHRPYSYYHDYGRYRYTKPSTYKKQTQLENKTKKSFQRQGKQFRSPYAKQRSGSSQLAKTSKSRPSSGSFRNASSYRNKSTSSNRRGSSRTSRGPRRGK